MALHAPHPIRYTPPVTSKKGVIGIGLPLHRCDASRSFSSAESAASLSVPQFMVARMGERKLRRFTQVVPGTPTRSSYRPQLALGAVVVAKRTTWRPNMAQLALGTTVASTPTLSAVNGTATALSTDVASHFGKRHDDVLKAIGNLLQELPADRLRNFAETLTERPNPAGGAPIQSRAYRLTRDGFTLLAMGFTGKKALAFKLAYLDAFNRMEAELAGRPLPIAPAPPVLALHTHTDLLDKLGLAASIGQLVQGEVFTELLKKAPINPRGLPVEARVLVNQHAARICAQTFQSVHAWVASSLHHRVRLDVPDGLYGRVEEQLRKLDHQSWLTQERDHAIQSLLVFMEVAKDVAAKGEAALNSQLAAMRKAQTEREYATGSAPANGGDL